MWNKHDILSNDIASKFEDRMFCNFGGGGTPGDVGGGQGGYGPGASMDDLDPFGGTGASVAEISSGRSTVAGERTAAGRQDDGNDESVEQMRARVAMQQAAQDELARVAAQDAVLANRGNMGFVQGRTGIDMPGVYGQAQMGRPFQPFAQLFQQGLPSTVTSGFAAGTRPLSQLMARQNYQPLPDVGAFGVGLNTLGQSLATGITERLETGGKPVYDPTGQIVGVMGQGLFGGEAYFGRPGFDPLQGGSQRLEDESGALMGYQSRGYTGDMGGDDDGGPDIPRAPVTAITPAEEPVAAAVTPQYIRPAGGFFPEEGLYYRRGLLDEPVPGLLDFTARNQAFRRGMATDASLYQMPYDLTGYTLL